LNIIVGPISENKKKTHSNNLYMDIFLISNYEIDTKTSWIKKEPCYQPDFKRECTSG